MTAFALPRVLVNSSTGSFSLDHPFPVISFPSHQVEVGDFVGLRVNDIDLGIVGKVLCLHGGQYQHRDLNDSEFLLQVMLIDDSVKQFGVSVPHPNGLD
jgi:hypothetical protein